MPFFDVTADDDAPMGDDFEEALRARFGGEEEPEAPEVSEGEDGSSPLPESPSEELVEEPDEEEPAPGFEIVDDTQETLEEVEPETPELPTEDDLDLNDLFVRWNGGTKPSREHITNLLTFVQQVASLPPDRAAYLNAVLQGQDPTPAPQPTTSAVQPAVNPEVLDNLSDEARAVLEPIMSRMEALEQQTHQREVLLEQQRLQEQQASIQRGVQDASREFVDSYQGVLTANDMILLETRVQQSGQFPFFLSQNNGDAKAAYKAMLEATAFADTATRDRIVAAQTAAAAQEESQANTRRRKASAVSAGGSAKAAPVTAGPRTKQAALSDAVADLATQLGYPRR